MVDLTNFEEGREYLAKNLQNLPFPEDELEKREATVQGIIANLLRQ